MSILGGQCSTCACPPPCNDCTQTCTNPHTGTAFATVYHYYVLGSEAGNTSDTYLTASGDVDTSDPYDGMDGTGPWYQEISGGFNFYPGATRFPCVLRFSFWRNNFPLGPTSVPPPSSTLTGNAITVTCQSGAVRVGDHIVNAGETYTTGATVPLVSGAGDQSGADPRSFDGTIGVSPVCDEAGFSIKARIDWNTKKRQHILYGIVRECYEVGTPCATACNGSAPPNVLYLSFSNLSVSIPSGLSPTPSASCVDAMQAIFDNTTYVLDRAANICFLWGFSHTPFDPLRYAFGYVHGNYDVTLSFGGNDSLLCGWVLTKFKTSSISCPSGTYSESGTANITWWLDLTNQVCATVDWEVSS